MRVGQHRVHTSFRLLWLLAAPVAAMYRCPHPCPFGCTASLLSSHFLHVSHCELCSSSSLLSSSCLARGPYSDICSSVAFYANDNLASSHRITSEMRAHASFCVTKQPGALKDLSAAWNSWRFLGFRRLKLVLRSLQRRICTDHP